MLVFHRLSVHFQWSFKIIVLWVVTNTYLHLFHIDLQFCQNLAVIENGGNENNNNINENRNNANLRMRHSEFISNFYF